MRADTAAAGVGAVACDGMRTEPPEGPTTAPRRPPVNVSVCPGVCPAAAIVYPPLRLKFFSHRPITT